MKKNEQIIQFLAEQIVELTHDTDYCPQSIDSTIQCAAYIRDIAQDAECKPKMLVDYTPSQQLLDLHRRYFLLQEEHFELGNDRENWPKYSIWNYRQMVERINVLYHLIRDTTNEINQILNS